MKYIPVVLVVSLFAAGSSKQEEVKSSDPATNNYSSGNPVTAPVDYLGAVSKAQQNSIGTIDIASVTSAVNLYQVSEGGYPKSLQELVDTGYLGKIPDAPYGKKLSYDPKTGAVTIVPAAK
jgi:hypothetical protein